MVARIGLWLRQEHGLGLVETTVTVGLVAVIVVVMMSSLVTHYIASRSIDSNAQATNLVKTQIEDIKSASFRFFGSYPVTVSPPAGYSVSITVVTEQPGLQRITVSVSRAGQTLLSVEMYKAQL